MLNMSTYYPLRKTIKKLNLHPNTLKRYADEKKIKAIRNAGGQRYKWCSRNISSSFGRYSLHSLIGYVALLVLLLLTLVNNS